MSLGIRIRPERRFGVGRSHSRAGQMKSLFHMTSARGPQTMAMDGEVLLTREPRLN
jgi:hypothetical protein